SSAASSCWNWCCNAPDVALPRPQVNGGPCRPPAGTLPAVDAWPDRFDRAVLAQHVIAVVGGGGHAGMVGQHPQPAADRELRMVDGAAAAQDAVFLRHAMHIESVDRLAGQCIDHQTVAAVAVLAQRTRAD